MSDIGDVFEQATAASRSQNRDTADLLERAMLASVVDKVRRKYDRLAAWAKADPDAVVTMKITVGELFQLKQFHTKFYDEAHPLIGDRTDGQ